MTAACPRTIRNQPWGAWPGWLAFALAVLPLVLPVETPAAPPAPPPREAVGTFITVQTPLTSQVVNYVKATTDRFLQSHPGRRICLIYDFNPDGGPSETANFGTCYDLASYLLGLPDVNTVAFVHNRVSRHTVLPVLACKEIVMAQTDATRLGPVLSESGRPEDLEKLFYRKVAEGRNRPPAVVLKMIDPQVVLVGGTRNGAEWFVDGRHLNQAHRDGFVEGKDPKQTALLAGLASKGSYNTADADTVHLCSLIRNSRREVTDAYGLQLEDDPLDGRTPVAWRVFIRGEVNSGVAESVHRQIKKAIGRGANLIIVQLECAGGSASVARDMADYLHGLTDDEGQHPVLTVAYVTAQAHSTAAFLALACHDIVMDEKAQLGDFEGLLRDRPNYRKAIRDSLVPVAENRVYSFPAVLIDGMFDPQVEVYRARNQKRPDELVLMDGKTLAEKNRNGIEWRREARITYPIRPGLAHEMGLAQRTLDGDPRTAMKQIATFYGIDKIHDAEGDWLDEIASFLRLPVVSFFLVMIGITGLILELKLPGVSVPGVISAVCFVLYFWSHSQMGGSLWLLAILLFVLGLIFIALEIFVVPGMGFLGISGVLLIIVSLALATLVKKPETTQEWLDFGRMLSMLAVGLIGAFGGAVVIGWYIPHVPYVSRLVLQPPGEAMEEAEAAEPYTSPTEQLAPLLGAIGEAMTVLRPAGLARFGDQFVDVIAEGSYVQPGARVQVIEIEGNRVVVKEV